MYYELVRIKYTIDFVLSYIIRQLKKILTKKPPTKMRMAYEEVEDELVFSHRPFDHFFPTWFFTIHKNASTIDFSGKPGSKNETSYQYSHG